MCVDLPLSPLSFNEAFATVVTSIPKYVNKNISCKLCIQDLTPIFGPRWNIVQTKGTSTQARIIGVVKLLFRLKYVQIQRHIEPG